MGTRATVRFYSERDEALTKPLVTCYFQFDGYINGGVGEELAEWLKGKKVINGISDQTMEQGYANGMGCLCAQYIAAQKTEIGGFYIVSSESDQDYNYHVYLKDKQLYIKVDGFNGTPQELLEYDENEAEDDEQA